jgi:ADP-heptose:LPS heptosyltransferase
MPIAVVIRRHFPQAFLAWAVEERAAPLLEGHPAIDERIVLPRGWLRSPAKVLSLRRQLKGLEFDTAIDVQGLTKSAAVAWLSGARRRIGMDGRWGRELSRWLNNTLVATDDLHAIERGLKLLQPLGIRSPAVEFQLPDTAADGRDVEEVIHHLGLDGGFVLLISGAGWPSKLWPFERYAAVAEYLGRKWRLSSLLVWGNDGERSRAEQIAASSSGHAVLAPRVTLRELAALARRARFAVGSDTGPLHLAAATGTRCIGLYGPWPADKHGPYGPQHINLQKMCMNGTTHQRRHASALYMEAIDVPTVCAACDRMAAATSDEIVLL